ncbi:copper homeostasis protein CutC [Arcanobacterium hippocoleae]|uniref:copper homeostasis protein CutC n=1 Tax=Arcanobacterium hippocoleae TaxID=149017 RepID=UPI00333FFBC0
MLEIIALNPEDIRQAARGGADRVELVGTMDADGLSPDHEQLHRAVVEAKKAGIAIRVMLRKRAGFLFEQTDQQALLQLVSELCENGADGVVLGFLDRFGNIDHSAISSLELAQMPVTFHRAIDAATDYFGAWEQLAQLAGRADFNLTQVLTAGSVQGVNAGLENILAAAKILSHRI